MPRNGSGTYSLPAGSTVANGDTSDASDVNSPLSDLESDANVARPISVGGTGATSASAARTNLGLGSIATQAASSVTITGGTINGASIGATTPSTGGFSELEVVSSFPILRLEDSDTLAEQQRWRFISSSGNFALQRESDDASVGQDAYRVTGDTTGAIQHRWSIGTAEVARFTSTALSVGTESDAPGFGNADEGVAIRQIGRVSASVDGGPSATFNRNGSDGNVATWSRQGSSVGTISVTASGTAYNTSSDYRLKQNLGVVETPITRLKALTPRSFEFIAAPGSRVDGFLAHEVQETVPEAVNGVKDGVEMQGIDQSKLVPLLTAALQEAIARIEQLEAQSA